MPRTHRIARTLSIAAAACASSLGLIAATTTTVILSGTGWRADADQPIHSIHPAGYQIVFADTTARSVLKPYATRAANAVSYWTGVPVTVTDIIDTTPLSSCPAEHRIIVTYEHQPMGKVGYSQARPCYDTRDNSAWGGFVRMDSEYWTVPNWFSPDPMVKEARLRGAVNHEVGHIFGLDHPNEDLDGDGTVEPYECVTESHGFTPLMCSPSGGNQTRSGGYFLPQFDGAGLAQLADNFYHRQQP